MLGHDVPFIVVSGKIGEDAAVGVLKAGADDYLFKENLSRLCPAIERELGKAEVRRERERAKEALARSEDRFRRLVEHVGRHSMQQRALELGGELEIESEPGEGTRVRFRVPITRLVQG